MKNNTKYYLFSSIKIIGAFTLAAVLLYLGFQHIISEEQRKLFFSVPLSNHFISILLVIPLYLIGGIEFRLLYDKISKIKLSLYDTITLPLVINLWGIIIPFQGSFIYTVSYIRSKYKKSITESVQVYVISFSISMAFAGLVGIFYELFFNFSHSPLFMIISILLLTNPYILFLTSKLPLSFKTSKSKWLNWFLRKLNSLVLPEAFDKELIIYLGFINIMTIAFTTLWSYYIAISLNINLTIIQLVLISLLMKITLLIKLTPGNIGFSQFASGGIAMLVGGSMNDGFLLSSFQYLTMIITAFTIGGLFSIINMKHFSFNNFKKTKTI